MTSSAFSRRNLLRGAVGGASALAAGWLLASCSPGGATGPVSSSKLKSILPTYKPVSGVPTPDLAGNASGLVDAYFRYPANPKRLSKGIPGDGSRVSALVQTNSPINPGIDTNLYWQQVNKQIGMDLAITQTPAGDYSAKVATVLAGNELPDFVQIQLKLNSLPQLLKAKFEDLSPYLSGDAALDYPFLAGIPTRFWSTSVVYNGGIYGIPVPAYSIPNYVFTRDDLLAARGLSTDFTTWDDFVAVCEEVNDPKNSRWALSHASVDKAGSPATGALGLAQQSYGVPNNWAEKNGKFTSANVDERQKDALNAVIKLVKKGLIYPDGYSGSTIDFETAIANGRAVMSLVGVSSLPRFYAANPGTKGFAIGGFGPLQADKSVTPAAWQRAPTYSFTAVKKGDKKRIRNLLEIANYLAAPFGSAEHRFINYGVEGEHYKLVDGDISPTDRGRTEITGFGLQYISAIPRVLYFPGLQSAVQKQYDIEKGLMPKSVVDPSLGLYSETDARSGPSLAAPLVDLQREIVRGNQPVSAWDDGVAAWRSRGGDRIRKEYEASYDAIKG